MKGRICVVTGATSGIGKETARGLAAKGAMVIIIGRNEEKCKHTVAQLKRSTGNSALDYFTADLSSIKEINRVADQIKAKYSTIDVLINNAGAKFTSRLESVDGYEMTFALNHLAYFLLTLRLLPEIKKSGQGRIIIVSSGAHADARIDFDDLQGKTDFSGKRAYGQSKLANVLFTYSLAEQLKNTRITVNALHPGGVATNFCRNNGLKSWTKHIVAHILSRNLISPKQGAKTSIYLAVSPEVEKVTGSYFVKKKPVKSSAASYDKDTAKKLWDVSLRMTGLS